MQKFTFMEFFSGGGMARAGLGYTWDCVLANDFDSRKAEAYRVNWGNEHFWEGDVATLPNERLAAGHGADLAWASFPCQDLSLAGNQQGLSGKRSGAFWGFWKHILALQETDGHPTSIVLENVPGLLSSNGGSDFAVLLNAFRAAGYRSGALIVDAVHFVPQSRPRLFILAVRADRVVPKKLISPSPLPIWTSIRLATQLRQLDVTNSPDWIWWKLPLPPCRVQSFADVLDDEPSGGVRWHTKAETEILLGMMSPRNLHKIKCAQLMGRRVVGTLYKRTRVHANGRSQRAEIRFDEIAGCLRTPGGGSSRQTLIVVDAQMVRSRLLSPREAARLMGLPEGYKLPANYNDAYRLAGDGVVVPVVRHLSQYILEPLLKAQRITSEQAA